MVALASNIAVYTLRNSMKFFRQTESAYSMVFDKNRRNGTKHIETKDLLELVETVQSFLGH